MSTETIAQQENTETTTLAEPESVPETVTDNAESVVDNREELMNLVINQETELGSTKLALEKAQEELNKLQSAWKQREDNEVLETKSKAEALSKALVDSWSASLPADLMTDENKKAIFAMAQNFPKESVKMLEIAHKASKKYKRDLEGLASQQQANQKRQLESRVMDIVTKKRRVHPTVTNTSVVHAASVKKKNPFSFSSAKTSSSLGSVRSSNPDLFKALSGFSSGNLRDRMGQIANISNRL